MIYRGASISEHSAKAALSGLPYVSRETLEDLNAYVDLLLQWQKRINLISPTTVADLWNRHILDSAQLYALAPEQQNWLDIGSGGGLPGLVLAIILKHCKTGRIHLVESNHKKAAFLQHVVTSLALPAQVHANRIEQVLPKVGTCDVVTARAFTDLSSLIAICNPLLIKGAVGLFPKGRDVERELTDAAKSWQFNHSLHPSLTDHASCIVKIQMNAP
jgi:16S rRNA (guanine527-N7)-methyltransferase